MCMCLVDFEDVRLTLFPVFGCPEEESEEVKEGEGGGEEGGDAEPEAEQKETEAPPEESA